MIFTPGQLNRRAELYHQLGAMIAAGVPLIQALEMAVKNSSLRASRKTILSLVEHLKSGLTFHDSMVRIHGWMPDFDKALLSAGEYSGRLDYSFKQLGTYYTARAAILRDTIFGLLRTIATIHVLILVFPLHYLTAMVIGIMHNDYVPCYYYIREKIEVFGLLYGIVFFLIFACQGKRSDKWRSVVEDLQQIIPIYRKAHKYLALTRLAAALGALVTSGISIVKGWPLATAASGSMRLKREVSKWEAELESGTTPAELVNRSAYFPEMFANLYHSGEISGKLDESLNRLQIYFHDEGFRTLQLFTRVINGVIYAIVVVVVAYFFINFYLSYFNAALNAF